MFGSAQCIEADSMAQFHARKKTRRIAAGSQRRTRHAWYKLVALISRTYAE